MDFRVSIQGNDVLTSSPMPRRQIIVMGPLMCVCKNSRQTKQQQKKRWVKGRDVSHSLIAVAPFVEVGPRVSTPGLGASQFLPAVGGKRPLRRGGALPAGAVGGAPQPHYVTRTRSAGQQVARTRRTHCVC